MLLAENDMPDEPVCDPAELGYRAYCNKVFTKAVGADKLASITNDVYDPYDEVDSLEFHHLPYEEGDNFAMGYCFESKDLAASALGDALDEAELIGKRSNCYVTIYDSYGPKLKPASGRSASGIYGQHGRGHDIFEHYPLG
jgi:hypothetical protein